MKQKIIKNISLFLISFILIALLMVVSLPTKLSPAHAAVSGNGTHWWDSTDNTSGTSSVISNFEYGIITADKPLNIYDNTIYTSATAVTAKMQNVTDNAYFSENGVRSVVNYGKVGAKEAFTKKLQSRNQFAGMLYSLPESASTQINELSDTKTLSDGKSTNFYFELQNASKKGLWGHLVIVTLTSQTIICDTIAPVISVKKNGSGASANTFFKANDKIQISATDKNLLSSTLNGQAIPSTINVSMLPEGKNSIVVKDKAENSTSFDFFVDKTSPAISVEKNGTSVSQNSWFNGNDIIKITGLDTLGIASFTLDGVSIQSGYTGTINSKNLSDGFHTISIKDNAENSSSFSFNVDKTLPTISLVNDKYHFSAGDKINIKTFDNNLLSNKIYKLVNGTKLELPYNWIYFNTATSYYDTRTPLIKYRTENDLKNIICNMELSNIKNGSNYQTPSSNGTAIDTIIVGTASYWYFESTKGHTYYFLTNENAKNYITDNFWKEYRGVAYTYTLPEEGDFLIEVIDLANNISSVLVCCDATAPTISIKKNGVILNDLTTVYFKLGDKINITSSDPYLKSIMIGSQGINTSTTYDAHTVFGPGLSKIIATDIAGNVSELSFTVDVTAPVISVLKNNDSVGDESYFKANDYTRINVNEEHLHSILLNGISITNNSVIDINNLANGTQTIVAIDKAGNQSTFIFYVDKEVPSLVVFKNGVSAENNTYFKASDKITINATDNNELFIKLNQNLISTLNTSCSSYIDGKYTLQVFDNANNYVEFSFYIDKTVPVLNIFKNNSVPLTSGSTSNLPLRFTSTDLDIFSFKLSLKNQQNQWDPVANAWESFNSTTSPHLYLATNGEYEAVITDNAMNSKTYTFIIDTIAPTGVLYSNDVNIDNGTTVNKDVIFKWSESGLSITVNSAIPTISYINNFFTITLASINDRNTTYTIMLTDAAGNKTSYTVNINRVKPTGTLNGVIDGGATRGNVSFTWNSSATAILNSDSYLSGKSVSAEGLYILTLTDVLGNINTYTFSIDKTPPTGTLTGVSNGGVTNKSVSFNWIENNCTATLNSKFYTKGAGILAAGQHNIRITDAVGNHSDYSFIIDLAAPEISVSENNNLLSSNNIINGRNNIAITFVDNSPAIFKLYLKVGNNWAFIDNSIDYLSNSRAYFDSRADFPYVFTSRAEASSFISKQEILKLTSHANWTPSVDGVVPQSEALFAQDGAAYWLYISSEGEKYILFDYDRASSFISLNISKYIVSPSVRNLNDEGSYKIEVTDFGGNISTFFLSIDKTPPIGILNGVANGGVTNKRVSFAWTENVATALLNGTSYVTGSPITNEGVYTLILTDTVGNATPYSFRIKLTPPLGILTGVENNGATKADVSFTWSELGAAATLNNYPYVSGNTIAQEGTFVIILTDLAENTRHYRFTIDKTAPVGVFSAVGNFVNNITYFNKDLNFTWPESTAVAVLNGNRYFPGEPITKEGVYSLGLTDTVGNATTYYFTVDKTAFTDNYDWFFKTYLTNDNHWFETFEYFLNNNSYVAKTYWSFSNYSDTLNYAVRRENGIVESYASYTGGAIICRWTGRQVDGFDVASQSEMIGNAYNIYYDIKDKNKLIAYFNFNNLSNAITKYATDSVAEKYIPNTPAKAFDGDDIIPKQHLYRDYIFINADSISFKYKASDVSLKINNILTTHDKGLSLGMNFITEIDYAGNEKSYVVILDRQLPNVVCKDYSENHISAYEDQFAANNKIIYTSSQFRLSILDEYDEQSLLIVIFNGTTTNIIDGYFDIKLSGEYTIKIRDLAGNYNSYTLFVSLVEPTITVEENKTTQGVLLGFYININKVLSHNNIFSITISKFNSDTGLFEQLLSDDEMTQIIPSKLRYYFVTSSLYLITVLDSYGRSIAIEYDFIKNAPSGALFSSDGIAISSGISTKKVVYFTWVDQSCSAYLNDLPYNNKTNILDEGTYSLRLVSLDQTLTTAYTFTIDRTAPTGVLIGVSENGFTNTPVSMEWSDITEKGTTALISKEGMDFFPYLKKSEVKNDGNYVIRLVDVAGNIKNYTFAIRIVPIKVTIKTSAGKVLDRGATTNQSFSFEWPESGATAYLNGQIYISKQIISNEGVFTLNITDKYNNTGFYTVICDKTPPIGTLSGVTNGGSTNGTISFNWTEKNALATLNNNEYVIGTPITAEGLYTLILTDFAGNKVTYAFSIDKTPPVGTLFGVENGGSAKYSVSFNWSDSGCIASLNGISYAKKTVVEEEGDYTLILTDSALNYTVYTFSIDRNPPIGVFSEEGNVINNVTYFNRAVSFSWSKTNTTAFLNKQPYLSSTLMIEEGDYVLTLTDKANNTTTYTFIIDKTPVKPTFSTTYFDKDAVFYFKTSFYLSWTGLGVSALINDEPYLKTTPIINEASYVIIISDLAGNKTQINAVCDFTAPKGSFSENGIFQGESIYFNKYVDFLWTDYTATATLNNADYITNTLITSDGSHTIILNDLAGNKTIYYFTILTTFPEGNFSIPGNVYENTTYFNSSTSFIFSSLYAATLNNESYRSNTTISIAAAYSLLLTDKAGNTTIYNFAIDRSPPSIIISGGSIVNTYTSSPFSFSWEDLDVISSTLNGAAYTKDSLIAEAGEYVFLLTDKANNISSKTVILMIEPPVGILTGVVDGGTTNGIVSFTWTITKATATLNGLSYVKNTQINKEGLNEIVLTNIAGLSTVYTFIIDKSLPIGTLFGVAKGGATNGKVSFTWVEETCFATLNDVIYINGSIIDAEGFYTIILTKDSGARILYTFTIDRTPPTGILTGVVDGGTTNGIVTFTWTDSGVTASINGAAYNKRTTISVENTYSLILSDSVGNSSRYSFTIDKTPPEGLLLGVTNDGVTNNDISFTWSEIGAVALLDNILYEIGTMISSQGYHQIILSDFVGNSSYYSFTIDKISPDGSFSQNYKLFNDVYYFSSSTSFKWSESGITATLNNNIFKNNSLISSEGKNILLLSDAAGNIMRKTIIIDSQAPEGIILGVQNGGYTNNDVFISWIEEGIIATLNSTPYENGVPITEAGEYVCILTDFVGNSSSFIFTIDKTLPTGTLIGVYDEGITSTDVSFTWLEEGIIATLNGQKYSKNRLITIDGSYQITLLDLAGNYNSYSFTIKKTGAVLYFDRTELFFNNNTRYFNSLPIRATATEMCSYYIDNILVSDIVLTTEGTYSLKTIDVAGNEKIYIVSIDITAPVVELSGVEMEGTTGSNVTISWLESNFSATLNGDRYSKGTSINNEGFYLFLITDNYNNSTSIAFSIDKTPPIGTLSGVTNGGSTNGIVNLYWNEEGAYALLNGIPYISNDSINSNGSYILILYDIYENFVKYEFSIDTISPTGTLSGVSNNAITNNNVSFTWVENGVNVTLNGEKYSKGTLILSEKKHIIVITDAVGNFSIYEFTIKKTAPAGTLSGVTNGGSTKQTVAFNWQESVATATLNGISYVADSLIVDEGDYEIILTDIVGNKNKWTFNIDRTPIDIEFSKNYVDKDGVYYFKSTFFISWKDFAGVATLNSESYAKNQYISTQNKLYTFSIFDAARNEAQFKFYIIIDLPIITITSDDGSDPLILKNSKTYELENSIIITPYLANQVYINDELITEDFKLIAGTEYVIKMINEAGGESIITIKIKQVIEDVKAVIKTSDYILIFIGFILVAAIAFFLFKKIFNRKVAFRRTN